MLIPTLLKLFGCRLCMVIYCLIGLYSKGSRHFQLFFDLFFAGAYKLLKNNEMVKDKMR